jgi:hypothetical protein
MDIASQILTTKLCAISARLPVLTIKGVGRTVPKATSIFALYQTLNLYVWYLVLSEYNENSRQRILWWLNVSALLTAVVTLAYLLTCVAQEPVRQPLPETYHLGPPSGNSAVEDRDAADFSTWQATMALFFQAEQPLSEIPQLPHKHCSEAGCMHPRAVAWYLGFCKHDVERCVRAYAEHNAMLGMEIIWLIGDEEERWLRSDMGHLGVVRRELWGMVSRTVVAMFWHVRGAVAQTERGHISAMKDESSRCERVSGDVEVSESEGCMV